MKFLVFNVVVIAAMIHLYADKNFTFEKMGDSFKGPTEQATYLGSENQTDTKKRMDLVATQTPATKRSDAPVASTQTAQPETKQVAIRTAATLSEADTLGTAPAAEPSPTELRPLASPTESVTKKSERSPPLPEAQRRRAEIIGHKPMASVTNDSPLPSRRQKLLAMAEEMELFSIEVTQ